MTASYNGTSSYLTGVASTTSNISSYFRNETSSDASTTDIVNKLFLAGDSSVYAQLHSPGDLSIQDTHGHIIGVVNGVATDTFPFASYDPQTKTAHIFFPQDDNLTYKITGTGSGVYGLDIAIASGTQQITFHRDENVPIVPGEVHTYTIDPVAIAQGKNGVTLKIDEKGNGVVNGVDQFGATLSAIAIPKLLPLPSTPFIPIVVPKVPTKVQIIYPIWVPPVSSTSTLNIDTSTSGSSRPGLGF